MKHDDPLGTGILTAIVRDLAHVEDLFATSDPDLNALFAEHEGEIIDGRRLVRLGLSDDGEDTLWQFIRTDVQ
jgi:hypothetical protein